MSESSTETCQNEWLASSDAVEKLARAHMSPAEIETVVALNEQQSGESCAIFRYASLLLALEERGVDVKGFRDYPDIWDDFQTSHPKDFDMYQKLRNREVK